MHRGCIGGDASGGMFESLARACSRAELAHAVDGARNDQALLRATSGAWVRVRVRVGVRVRVRGRGRGRVRIRVRVRVRARVRVKGWGWKGGVREVSSRDVQRHRRGRAHEHELRVMDALG